MRDGFFRFSAGHRSFIPQNVGISSAELAKTGLFVPHHCMKHHGHMMMKSNKTEENACSMF